MESTESKLLDWLRAGEPSIRRLANIYLLEQDDCYSSEGWIDKYLKEMDKDTHLWGNGIYGPKWISTFYTLRELILLRVDSNHPSLQAGLDILLEKLWIKSMWKQHDDCVLAMLLTMLIYGNKPQKYITEITDYLISQQLPDGGFNCDHKEAVKSSSIHTTLTVLECFSELLKSEYKVDRKKINEIIIASRDFLLRKKLLRRETDHELIQKSILRIYYPTRWFYDYLRVLVYFADSKVPYDERMEEALQYLITKFKRGKLPKGATHTGLFHFPLESDNVVRMNTLNGLRVLKFYEPQLFLEMMQK